MQFQMSQPLAKYRLVEFGRGRPSPSHDLAWLQQRLLPTSPACAFGPEFLEQFYFSVLPDEGYIFGTMAYYDDRPAGLTVASMSGRSFISSAAWRHPLLLARILTGSLIRNPTRFGNMISVMRIMRVPCEQRDSNSGQWLTTATLPEFSGDEFKTRTGRHIASDMSNCTMMQFYRAGVTQVFAYMDKSNTRSRERGIHRGWKLNREDVPEWPVPCVEYVTDPAEYLRAKGLLNGSEDQFATDGYVENSHATARSAEPEPHAQIAQP